MNKLTGLINNIYEHQHLPSPYERRKALVDEMNKLESGLVHCFNCPGTCCTSVANSMMVSPIEALEVIESLKLDSLDQIAIEQLKKTLLDCIKSYRLDVEIYTGKKSTTPFRKTYTCPFFKREAKGCGLSRSAKPYGCLGFNPKAENDNGQTCTSNKELLEIRDDHFSAQEHLANLAIQNQLQLSWSKKDLPSALIELLSLYER